MSLFGDGLKTVVKRIDDMRSEYLTMTANFANLERSFDRFVEHTDKKIDKILNENEDLRRRVTEMEAIINATFKSSAKEALQAAFRDHLRENGDIDEMNDSVKRILNLPSDTSTELDDGKR